MSTRALVVLFLADLAGLLLAVAVVQRWVIHSPALGDDAYTIGVMLNSCVGTFAGLAACAILITIIDRRN
jgi:hypothetical protein